MPKVYRITHQKEGLDLNSYYIQYDSSPSTKTYVFCHGYYGINIAPGDTDEQIIRGYNILLNGAPEFNMQGIKDNLLLLDNKGYYHAKDAETIDANLSNQMKIELFDKIETDNRSNFSKMHIAHSTNPNLDVQIYRDVLKLLKEQRIDLDPNSAIGIATSFGGIFLSKISREPDLAPTLSFYIAAVYNIDDNKPNLSHSYYILSDADEMLYNNNPESTSDENLVEYFDQKNKFFKKYKGTIGSSINNIGDYIINLALDQNKASFRPLNSFKVLKGLDHNAISNMGYVFIKPYTDTQYSFAYANHLVKNIEQNKRKIE